MNSLFFVVALALAAAVYGEEMFTYTHPDYGCVYTVTADVQTLFTHSSGKLWVNKNMTRMTSYNHRGILMSDKIIRRDLPPVHKVVESILGNIDYYYYPYFVYSAGGGCTYYNETVDKDVYDFDPVLNRYMVSEGNLVFFPIVNASYQFPNKSRGKFEGEEYDLYYYDVQVYKDFKNFSIYVDSKNYIIAAVENEGIVDERTVYKFTYDHRAAPEDFVFVKSKVYNCSYSAIFDEPVVQSAIMCAASATKVAIFVVVASLISTFIALF
jgi:hypothetical protein